MRITRLETIRSSAEISALFKKGKRVSNRYITLIYSKTLEPQVNEYVLEHGHQGRVAFIAGKKSGNACWRNAAKRRMREIARQSGAPWPGYDILFVAKRGITQDSYSKVLSAVKNAVFESDIGKHDE